MSVRLLQINFRINVPAAMYEEAAAQLADGFAAVAGLRWKIWILNEAESEAGGIYLFEDQAALDAFLAGPLAAQVKAHPAVSDLSARQFAVMAGPTEKARGPVG
jgi:hypothetical protein